MILRKTRSCWAEVLSTIRIAYYRRMGTTIGKNCYISSRARIDVARGRVSIGNKVEVANGSYILAHTGHRPQAPEDDSVTRLEDNVKVFVNSVVMPGVRIGENSIVGAGSVVVRDVPPNVVVMGNPARVIEHLDKKKN